MDIIQQIKKSNVSYHVLGKSDRSAMPIGNGELCASVWTNKLGEICFYLSRSDALTELDRTVKLGMVKLSFEPNPFVTGNYCQTLDVADGMISFQGEEAEILMCVDTEEDRIVVQGCFDRKTTVRASYHMWRNQMRYGEGEFEVRNRCAETADIVYTTSRGILFYHKNGRNIIGETARLQKVDEVMGDIPDALTNRIFGGHLEIRGGRTEKNSVILDSTSCFFMSVLTESMQGTEEEFSVKLTKPWKVQTMEYYLAHCKAYWNAYWENSYIFVEHEKLPCVSVEENVLKEIGEITEYETECTSEVTNAYILTRFMMKCCGNGTFPILYNGMLFNLCPGKNQHFHSRTFGEVCTALPGEYTADYNPDERSWCTEHLWQNVRHPYHTFLPQGEQETMKVLFSYYKRFWELNRFRAKKYYGAEGQHNTEMTLSCGLQSNAIYGVNREGKKVGYAENRYGGAVDISPGLELLALMLDYYEYTDDTEFFREEVQIYAKELYRYIETRFRAREDGKLVLEPLNSIETYWDAKNPITVIAGLHGTIHRILKAKALEQRYREYFEAYVSQIPELCYEEEDGSLYLLPAEKIRTERMNVEIPELYACFPFGIFNQFHDPDGIMRRTFEKRMEEYHCNQCFRIGKTPNYPSYSGWQYHGIVAARLGMTSMAQRILSENVQLKNPGTRFPAMWGPIYDGVPDTDHGANIVHLLQEMVMQTENGKIYLLPAFPKEWNVAFKLHPDGKTTLECVYECGVLKNLKITPDSEKDRIIQVNRGGEKYDDIERAHSCSTGT